MAQKPKARREPETLRLKSFTPSLTVSDLRKSLAFYTQTLGFFVGESWTEGDLLRGVMLKAGACELGLSQDDWKLGRDRKKGEGVRIWCDTAQDGVNNGVKFRRRRGRRLHMPPRIEGLCGTFATRQCTRSQMRSGGSDLQEWRIRTWA